MQYVVFDLEWNNVYGRKIKGFINEIIEIGAVKLDENLNEISSFSSFVKPSIGKRLRGSVKKLTNITNDDVLGGEPFTQVFSSFRKWIGAQPTVILTWGDGDIRVLIENYKYLNGIAYIPFLTDYVDLQTYVQRKVPTEKGQQIGLGKAAEALGIDGLILTKLDGTAKGGVVIGVSDQFKIPVRYVGLGEGIDDLQPFNKKEFVDSLF